MTDLQKNKSFDKHVDTEQITMSDVQNLLSSILSPESTKLFKETNPFHLNQLSDNDFSKDLPYSTFGIIIEDWTKGTYCFVNSKVSDGLIENNHFTPNNAKPLKTIGDLNDVWKSITGKHLTVISK
ncbi:MAG: hypothetical protein E6Q68_06080 [Polynucleobacter sp.]|nr:MAG: hypothetical protein E6Q68_06080 [Polynucleobacter sp.]